MCRSGKGFEKWSDLEGFYIAAPETRAPGFGQHDLKMRTQLIRRGKIGEKKSFDGWGRRYQIEKAFIAKPKGPC